MKFETEEANDRDKATINYVRQRILVHKPI